MYKLNRFICIFLLFLIVFGSIFVLPTNAAGLTSMSISGTGITAGASATSVAITPTINFTTTNAVANTETITIILNGTVTVASIAQADITAGGVCSGAATMSTVVHPATNPVLAITGLTCTPGVATIAVAAVRLTSSSSGGNYSISIVTPQDYGAFLYYVGNTNQVRVTATVTPSLSFAIRNTTDTAEQGTIGGLKVCALGILSTTGVGTCSYRLKVGTNAASGYTVSYKSDTRLTNGTYNFTDAAIGGGGTVISAGTEGYGVVLTPGASSSGATITRDNANFGANAANSYRITQTAGPYAVYTSNGTNAPTATDVVNTALVDHQAAISAATPTGNYLHTITYIVSAVF